MRKRLIQFFHEYSPDVILVLAAIAIFIVVPKVFGDLVIDKEAHGSINLALKIVGTALAVVGSIASYRRFFRGRIFAPRLRIALANRAVIELSDGNILHASDVEAENVGGVTIWNPSVTLKALELFSDAECTVDGTFSEGIQQSLRPGGISGIEPGELVVYHFRYRVPASVEAFRITVELSVDRCDAWHRSLTVANTVAKNK